VRRKRGARLLAAVLALFVMSGAAAHAGPDPNGRVGPGASTPPKPPTAPATTDPAKRSELLGQGWQQSGDRLWTTTGDETGLHLLVAEAKTGYSWRTAATLAVPGLEADQWIGNACVTASGKRAVVAYAPRSFTNQEQLDERGAFTAVVDLDTGKVTTLPVRTTLEYYNPGCGAGETAALTQDGGDNLGRTRLLTVDTTTGEVGAPTELRGQLTSAIPVADGYVAAATGSVVHVAPDGHLGTISPSTGTPFRLAADGKGGVVFMDTDGKSSRVRRAPTTAPVGKDAPTLATGALQQMSVTAAGGKVFITGRPDHVQTLPSGIARLDLPTGTAVSTTGETAVSGVQAVPDQDPSAPQTVHIQARSLKTGKDLAFDVRPGATVTSNPPPGARPNAKLAPNSSPVDDGRYCAVPRNDPNTQVYQPTPSQVEWAADMAVKGDLLITRPANWHGNGLGAYVPQQMFPPVPLKNAPAGAGVPAQVLLGVLGQESNLWQAARGAMPGETGNPLVGNYYGIDYYDGDPSNDWTIAWDKSDCGYGVSQMTDGMRLPSHPKQGETEKPWAQQQAIATDYAANVAAGLQLLQTKWNQLQDLGLTVNNNDPSKIENWFMVIWAYNSGYHPPNDPTQTDTNGAYGLGWLNNPINPRYPANRAPFGNIASDFAHPQDWPYPEKVIGFAAHPPAGYDAPGHSVPFFRSAWWNGDSTTAPMNRDNAKPPIDLFCTSADNCYPGQSNPPNAPGVGGEKPGPCAHQNSQHLYDLKCWWHQSVTWKTDCYLTCGNEFIRYDYPAYKNEPADGSSYPPDCGGAGLPAGSLIIDDIAGTGGSVRAPGCARQNNGSFDFAFASGVSTVDLHQLGSGYGGHFWYSHTDNNDALGQQLGITGTWTLGRSLNQWTRVLVHVPTHGAVTQQAHYSVSLGSGAPLDRYVNQDREQNAWLSLGVYPVNGVPSVSLTNVNPVEGRNVDDVAWDAVAFQPLPAKPKNVVAVLGDSFTSGEGAGNYLKESDNNHGTPDWAACRRSMNSWARKLVPPDNSGQSLGVVSDNFGTQSELGFVACSGAKTWNVDGVNGDNQHVTPTSWVDPASYDTGEGQFREISQVDSGVLTPYTTLVALTIGGNDNGAFQSALVSCLPPLSGCGNASWTAQYHGYIDSAQQGIAAVIRAIAGRAPQAQIVLVGYPPDEFQTADMACQQYSGFTSANASSLYSMAQYMEEQEKKTVTAAAQSGIKVAYGDPGTVFDHHGVCAGSGPSWFNTTVVGPNGEGDFHNGDKPSLCLLWTNVCLSRESYHPNDSGTGGLATVVQNTLNQIGYHGS
jgi:hypothetical protein